MKRSIVARFFSQHRTPIIPQVAVDVPTIVSGKSMHVGYLLCRNQIVKHSPHPLEIEHSYMLEREHQRYCRHEGSESLTHFLAARGQTMDALNRSDPGTIEGNFYGIDLYQDAMRVVLQRYQPEKRVTSADLVDPTDERRATGPPPRVTLQRALDDYLYLIIKKENGKWTIPSSPRSQQDSLRTAVDRALTEHHGEAFDTYMWSNAPQAVLRTSNVPSTDVGATEQLLFVYSATYLSGRPQFEAMGAIDHAWVRRCELPQYAEQGYEFDDMLETLMDITLDATFDGAMS